MAKSRPFESEALSIANTIHRAITLGSTREKMHSLLESYHENRFHAAANKMQKANAMAVKYKEGSAKHIAYTNIANAHMANAQRHNDLFAHHAQAQHDSSFDGYEHNENMNKKMNIMAFNKNQIKKNMVMKAPAAPTQPVKKPVKLNKPPVLPANPKIVTPKPVKNVITPKSTPLEDSLSPTPPKLKTPGQKKSNLPSGGLKPKRVAGPKPVKFKANPIVNTPKAPKPPTIKATPIKKAKPIKIKMA